jgi:hypothetical protein
MPSSVIRTYSYDAATNTLFVTFTSGELYACLDVPPQVPEGMRRVISKGRYFSRHIRDRYQYRRMGPDDGAPAQPAHPRGGGGPGRQAQRAFD